MKKWTLRTRIAGVGALICAFAVTAVAYGAVTPIPPDDPVSPLLTCVPVPGGLALQGDGADDKITGTPNNDVLFGGGGGDTITALSGDDPCIDGGNGKDVVRGGPGDDTLFGGDGRDELRGGPGDDELLGDDIRGTDEINCGAGHDLAWADDNDVVKKNCEITKPPH